MPSTGNILDVAPQGEQVTALANAPRPHAASRESDQSLEARRAICGLPQGDTALMRGVDTQEVANPQVLDVAEGAGAIKASVESVGDERVSGTVEGHGDRVSVCETRQPVTPDVKSGRSEHQASPADSQNLDRHGDDRFADNILRALEGLDLITKGYEQ